MSQEADISSGKISIEKPAQRLSLGRIDSAWALVLPIIIVVVLLYIVPLLYVFQLSISDPKWGLDNYERLVTMRGQVRVMLTTFRISAISATLAVILGFLVALAMTWVRGVHQQVLVICVMIPLWISVLVRGFSWLVLLRDNGPLNDWLMAVGLITEPLAFVRNELGVVIGMVHYLLPFAILPMYSVMQGIDERLLFASRSLGASARTTFAKVYIPMALPGIMAATIIVFVFGLGFYVTPVLLGGGRVVMLAESVSVSILTTARWGLGAAQSMALLAVTLCLVGILSKTVGLKKGLG